MKKWVYLSAYWIGISLLHSAYGATPAEAFLAARNRIQTMQADYVQVVSAHGHEVSRARGEMQLARPNRFRWQTRQPMSQLVIADGQRIWVYDVDLEQVTVRKQGTQTHTGFDVLLNTTAHELQQLFRVDVLKKTGALTVFDLTAHSGRRDLRRLLFVFNAEALVRMELFDALGQHTVVRFEHTIINQPIASRAFTFTPPKGVDVLRAEDTHD